MATREYYQAHREEILEKTRKDYYKNREARKEKVSIYQRGYYAKNVEMLKAKSEKHYADNREKILAHRKTHPLQRSTETRRAEHLKKRYDLTLEEYEAMYVSQSGLCAICGFPPKPGMSLCVDHDHETGTVRGLLCHHCNAGIGYLRDNPQVLSNAIAYLERN